MRAAGIAAWPPGAITPRIGCSLAERTDLIVFTYTPTAVRILRIIEGHRDLPPLFPPP